MNERFSSFTRWWRQSLKRHFFVWAVLLAVVVLVLGGVGFVRPKLFELNENRQAESLRTELEGLSARFTELKGKAAAWQSLKQTRGIDLDLMLPSSADVPNVLAQLEALVISNDLTLQSIAVSGLADASLNPSVRRLTPESSELEAVGVRPLKITLSVADISYAKVKTFLESLEQAWRIVRVNGLNFTAGENASATFELTSYYYAE